MKINSWSVAKSPIGISIKHIKDKKLSSVEVCVAMVEGKVQISVYQEGVDEPITQALHNTNRVALVRKKQPKNTKAYRDWVRKETNAYVYELRKKQSAEFVPPVSLSKVTKKKGGKV